MQMTVESMADIEAEIRARAKAWNEPTLAQYDERLADRIHAAHEREKYECLNYWTKKCRDAIAEHDRYHGNAAAIREALKALRKRFDNNVMAYQDRYFKFSGWHWHKKAAEAARWRDVFLELREACDTALSMPPRNCDVGTAEEQVRRFERYCDCGGACNHEKCKTVSKFLVIDACAFAWAQMPYEKESEAAHGND